MPRRRPLLLATALCAIAIIPVAGCGDDDEAGGATETVTVEATTTEAGTAATTDATRTSVDQLTPAELETWQTDLNAVGCYAGPVDGELGPETEAAIKEFQSAAGLSVDGLLGPETESALQTAVSDGETVCTTPPATTTSATTTTSGGGAVASLTAADYDQDFTIESCTLDAEEGDVAIAGSSAGGLSLRVQTVQDSGTLTVRGGDEQDGITLNGNVSNVNDTADREFTVTGVFTEPNLSGEGFRLEGSCPE